MNRDSNVRIQEAKHIRRYVSELTRIFKDAGDKYPAHEKSRRILEDMSTDPAFLTALLQRHLSNPNVLNAKNYPVVAVNVELNPYYHLVAHCWLPLPNRDTE